MIETQQQFIEEVVRLELNMAKCYISFHNIYPEDASFWWRMASEGKKRASLLKNGSQHYQDADVFPGELVSESLEALIDINGAVEGKLKRELKYLSVNRCHAFKLAIQLEESAGDVYFQHGIQLTNHPSEGIRLFQDLNENCRYHASMMRSHMSKNGLT